MINNIKIYWKILSKSLQIRVLLQILLMVISAALDVLSISSVIPFVGSITDPQVIIDFINSVWGCNAVLCNQSNLVTILATGFITLTIISSFIRSYTYKLSLDLSANIGSLFSRKIFVSIITDSYENIKSRDPSQLKNVLSYELNTTVGGLGIILQTISSSIVAFAIAASLLVANFKISLFIIVVLGSFYALIDQLTKRRLSINGQTITLNNQNQFKLIQESISLARDIILGDRKSDYIDKFSAIDIQSRKLNADSLFLASYPKYLVESLGIILLCLLVIYVNLTGGSISSFLPYIALLAFSSQKLLPSIQSIYSGLAILRAYKAPMASIARNILNIRSDSKLFHATSKDNSEKTQDSFLSVPQRNLSLVLDNVSFKYTRNSFYTIKHANIKMYSGDFIGIVGESGAGKSTLQDIILTLLHPTQGKVVFNGSDITDCNQARMEFLKNIAHVPQDIYLIGGSVAENIALTHSKQINYDRVVHACQQSMLDSFIRTLPSGYETPIGPGGYNLSGGQRQRIGIARALYKNPMVLFLDEATSALDKTTEDSILNNIKHYFSRALVLMTSHHPESISHCSKIITVKNGNCTITTDT